MSDSLVKVKISLHRVFRSPYYLVDNESGRKASRDVDNPGLR